MPLSLEQFVALRAGVLHDLGMFAPELLVAGTIALVLALRLVRLFDRIHLGTVAAIPLACALLLLVRQWNAGAFGDAFGGMLNLDRFALFARGFLLVFAILALYLGKLTNLPDAEDSADYIVLLLGGTLGMMVMASANHLLMVFLGLEMASLPSYALAGFIKGKRTGSEASLKYVLYGSAASGIALYGLSLLAVRFGTVGLPELAAAVQGGAVDPLAAAGLLFLFVGFAFKLSAVPFHFWCPDIFEGAAAEVGAFLSVASKGAAVALTARVAMALHLPSVGIGLMILAGVTATFGNFAALAQTNLQRMLAYSTIAHAGYMLMGLCVLNAKGVSAVLYYLAAYLPANLIAFAVVAFLGRAHSGTLDDLRGLVKRSPVLAIAFVLALLSLLGLPPLGGFAGKFQVFEAVYDAGRHSDTPWAFHILLAVGVLNTVVSAGFYLRAVRMVVLEEPEGAALLRTPVGAGLFVMLLAAALVAAGLVWNPLERLAASASGSL
jgi:NADH-quinone oxidoreductase subunit N